MSNKPRRRRRSKRSSETRTALKENNKTMQIILDTDSNTTGPLNNFQIGYVFFRVFALLLATDMPPTFVGPGPTHAVWPRVPPRLSASSPYGMSTRPAWLKYC